jgi:class 3 adenylate cyclase
MSAKKKRTSRAANSVPSDLSHADRVPAGILFGDMKGSTAAAEKDEVSAVRVLRDYLAFVHDTVHRFSPRFYKVKAESDGFMARFANAHAMVECGIALQEGFLERQWKVRLGGNYVEAFEDGDGDLLGVDMNRAARIASAADADRCQFLVSQSVPMVVRNRVSGIIFRDFGPVEAKGVDGGLRTYEVVSVPKNPLLMMPHRGHPDDELIATLPTVGSAPSPEAHPSGAPLLPSHEARLTVEDPQAIGGERLRPPDVFTTIGFPRYTYVDRSDLPFENELREALVSPGIVSISGPSKTGKSLLVEHVVPPAKLVQIDGASVRHADDVWYGVLRKVMTPLDRARALAEGENPFGLASDVLSTRDLVLLIEDFHYVEPDARTAVARQVKSAAHAGGRVVLASVPFRTDDVVRSNPDLRGRIRPITTSWWDHADLRRIAELGFKCLDLDVEPSTISNLIAEAVGSPHLMQSVCLHACAALIKWENSPRLVIPMGHRSNIFHRVAKGLEYGALLDSPAGDGQEKRYQTEQNSAHSTFSLLMEALGHEPAQLEFSDAELIARMQKLCIRPPVPSPSEVRAVCAEFASRAKMLFPNEALADWHLERNRLQILDPLLLFYARWGAAGQIQDRERRRSSW